jgi:uncharacterized membrane protein
MNLRRLELVGEDKRIQRWGLLAILLLALGLRLIALQSRSIQYDDAFSYFLARRDLADIVRGTAADTMPPLYYFLLHFWMQISDQLWFLRLLSVLLSLGIVGLTYQLAAQLFHPQVGLVAAFLAAISPLQIYHGQDLRMYAPLALGQLGYYVFFVRILRKDGYGNVRDWVGLVVSAVVAMYSHNLAIFGLAVVPLWLILRRKWGLLGRVLLALLVVGILALPWLWMVPGQVEKIQRAFWTPRPGILEVFQAILMFTVHLPLEGGWLVAAAVLSLQLLALIVFETWRDRKRDEGLGLVVAIALGLPAILFVVSYLIRPVFVPRGFLVASLAYFVLAGRVVVRRWRRGIGAVVLGGFVLAALFSLPFYYTFNSFPRSPFNEAMNALRAHVKPGDVIVHDNKLSFFPAYFYAPDLPMKFIADVPGSHNDTYALESQKAMQLFPEPDLESAVQNAQRVYFVTFTETIDEYQALGEEQHPALRWLEERYTLAELWTYGDLLVLSYEHH